MTSPSSAANASPRRALVTGATGFIGSHLVARLAADGWDVHALVRSGSRGNLAVAARTVLHLHDGTTEGMAAIVGAAAPDVVFHLASLFIAETTLADVTGLVESNVLLGTQLAEAMRVHRRTLLVNTGTVWQHYRDEDYHPVSLYAATKQAYADILRFYVEAAGLQVITLELFESYGPADSRPKLMTALRRAALADTRPSLTDGRQELDFVHVRDIARAYAVAAERLLESAVRGHEVYMVRSGRARSVRELVALFGAARGRPLDAEWGARAYRAREMMRPWAGGETLPGWSPEVALEDGIRELLRDPPAGDV